MKYEFPEIFNLSQMLPAIEGSPEFVVAEREGYTVVNYNVHMPDTFPPIKVTGGSAKMREERSLHNKLRRECRGIIFCSETGKLLRRPFHKFFNVNEKIETQDHTIDLSQPHVILEKLDGSMIVPFIVNGQLIFGTKMGDTDVAKPVQEFVDNNSYYCVFANQLIQSGLSPIFEWCSRKQRIVIDHPEDQLILTAIRRIDTGNYLTMDSVLDWASHYGPNGIPVVRQFDPATDMKEFIEYTRGLEDTEGFVIRFDDGHMVKLKCDWYVQIHKAKDAMLWDRHIVSMILEGTIDDVKAHLLPDDRLRLEVFESEFADNLRYVAQDAADHVDLFQTLGIDRKTFAVEKAQSFDPFKKNLMFAIWDCPRDEYLAKATEIVLRTVKTKLGNNTSYAEIQSEWWPEAVYNER